MRVLLLAPPAHGSNRVTAHTFIDEEIEAIRDGGVECIAVSDAIAERQSRHGVTVEPVRPNTSPVEAAAAIAFAARHAIRVPMTAVRAAKELLHAVRIEREAARAAAAFDVDLIHSHFGWPGGFGGALAAAHAGVPLVASLRGMDLLMRPDIGYGLRRDAAYDGALRRLLRTATRTLYATEFMRDRGLELGAVPERAVTIRKGVDLIRFHPPADRCEARQAIGVSGPMILAVGGLSARKGVHVVLDALALVRRMPWTFVVCGEGVERRALERRAAELAIADRVRFVGSVDRSEIGRYFSAADVFVHAALMEAAGNVILEALAAGCPVVCTDSGGPSEYIDEGHTGFTVAPGDHVAIADRLGLFLTCASLRLKMSRLARAAAEQRYAYARMIADYLAVYRSAIAAQRSV